MSWLCSNGALMGRPAQESSTAGNCRKSPSSRNFTSAPHAGQVRPERHVQLRDLLHHQPVKLLRAAAAHVPAHPVVGRLRPQPQVLRGAVRLGHQVHRLALLSQPCPGQVLSGARQAREQQGARQWPTGSSTPFHRGAPPPCAAPCCPATASSLPRGRPACRPGGAAPPAPAARFGSRCVSRQSVFTCAR